MTQAPGFDAGAVLLGTLCHFAVSIGWGLLFGLLFFGLSKPMTLLMGGLWGIVVWLGMYYAVLPLVGLREMARSTPIGMAVAIHLLFGILLDLGFLPFQRRKAAPFGRRPMATAPG